MAADGQVALAPRYVVLMGFWVISHMVRTRVIAQELVEQRLQRAGDSGRQNAITRFYDPSKLVNC